MHIYITIEMLTHPYLNSANSTAKMDGFSLPSSSSLVLLGFSQKLVFLLIRENVFV